MFENGSAAQLAYTLDGVDKFPHNTGGMSGLDAATMEFGRFSPDVSEAHRAFSDARHRHHRSYTQERGGYSEDAWQETVTAAKRLAAALRPLGDLRIARCERKSTRGPGVCGMALDSDGVCRSDIYHPVETS